MITCGEGKYKVWLKKEMLGADILYTLGGGERPHIGAVVVKEQGRRIRTLRMGNHYDHIVLKPIVMAAYKKYRCTVVGVGGVHIDNATKDEIRILVNNCKGLIACI
jgi:hypothetical protein